jgi:glutathione S-transferase
MSDNKLILGYWAIRGLAQPIRLFLAFGEFNWEDVRYVQTEDLSRAQWTDKKFELGLDFPVSF